MMARLLIIEDDSDMSVLLAEVLSDAGHEVTVASNGADGLQRLRGARAPFDLVVTDILMPGRDGLEVLWEVQLLPAAPKVIAISGAPARWMMLRTAEGLGAARTLAKPFTRKELIGAVDRVLGSV